MDGVDLDIEIGSHKYYPDFVREMRRLMNTDKRKQYLITAAPQCPFPDKWMGPQIQGSALEGVYVNCWQSVFLRNSGGVMGPDAFVSLEGMGRDMDILLLSRLLPYSATAIPPFNLRDG